MNLSGLSAITPPPTPTKQHTTFVWTPIFPENLVMPCMRSKHAACVAYNFIYIFGGRDSHSSRKDLWRYNVVTNVWTSLECSGMAPPLLQDHTMVYRDNKLYIFGGELGFGASDETPLWSYDLIERCWAKEVGGDEVKKPMGRRGHTATIANDVMYMYGGYLDLKGSSSELWLYDFESGAWHIDCLSQLNEPPARHNHSAVLHDNAIWIYGGLSNLLPKADLWKWDIDYRKWLRIRFHQGPTALNGHSACVHNNYMFIFGGEDASNTARNDLWVFSFVSHSWSKVSAFQGILPSPNLHHTLLPVLSQVHLNSDANVQYRTASVPHLQPHNNNNNTKDDLSPPRPYSSPPIVDRSPSQGVDISRMFQNRVGPSSTGLLSPAAAQRTVIVNRNAEDSNIMFTKRKLNLDLDNLENNAELSMIIQNEQDDGNQNNIGEKLKECKECHHHIASCGFNQSNKCTNSVSQGTFERGFSTIKAESSKTIDENSCQELQLIDLENDIDYINFTEQTKLLSLQQHSRIYPTDDDSNGFYNNGYIPAENCHGNSVQHPTDFHSETYVNSNKTENYSETEHKIFNHQRDTISIPKIVEPVNPRQYGRSNTLDAQNSNKQNVNTEWCLAKDKQRQYSTGKQVNENILCMYLMGGKEGGSNSVTGIKTPLAMWKCGMIPGKLSSQQVRKMMTEMTP